MFDSQNIGPQLEQLEMRAVGPVRQAGREAIRLDATMSGAWKYVAEPLWWDADDYEPVVDAERGVVLRLASRFECPRALGGKDMGLYVGPFGIG